MSFSQCREYDMRPFQLYLHLVSCHIRQEISIFADKIAIDDEKNME